MSDARDRTTPPARRTSAHREPVGSPVTRAPEITLRRLQIFWAVANSETLTKASKQLGLAQPSISQQISSLESVVGAPLFERRSNQLFLTEAGSYLLRKAEQILRDMQDLEDGVRDFGEGTRQTIRLAGLNSVLRIVVPLAMTSVQERYPGIDFDVQESAPADVLELLYARRTNIGIIASNSIAQASAGFHQIPIMNDPYVLVVPAAIDLRKVGDPASDLTEAERSVLNHTIQFAFGTQHTKRDENWFDVVLPDNRPFAKARSYEVALSMVRAGLGVCLAPALSAVVDSRTLEGVDLYEVSLRSRQIVAMLPSQYLSLAPYALLLDALRSIGREFELPAIRQTPEFLRRAEAAGGLAV
ncbi:MAG TPA: LysR family transcriptional regulator [Devosiaceae bacterium]|nr:LysR family transcriptional regulator [Devosiaceae bacterium]